MCCLLSVQEDQDKKWGDGMAPQPEQPSRGLLLNTLHFWDQLPQQGPPHVSSQPYDTRTYVCSLTEPNCFMPPSLCSPRQSIQVSQGSGFTSGEGYYQVSRTGSHGQGQEEAQLYYLGGGVGGRLGYVPNQPFPLSGTLLSLISSPAFPSGS